MFQNNSQFGLPFYIMPSKMFQHNVEFGLPYNIIYLQPVNIKVSLTYLLKVKPINL